MREHVPIELVFLRKGLFAETAFVRFVSVMNSLVVFEVRAFDKSLVAESTPIRLDTRYTGVVIALAFLVSKDLIAHVALVTFWSSWYYCYVTAVTTFGTLALSHRLSGGFFFCLTILKIKKIYFINN